MTNTDEYPFPGIYMEELLIKILTTEYKLESQVLADINNNSKDASQLTQIVE